MRVRETEDQGSRSLLPKQALQSAEQIGRSAPSSVRR